MPDPTPSMSACSGDDEPAHDRIRLLQIPTVDGAVTMIDDPYSDRIRCDHPNVSDAAALGDALMETADSLGRGRVVAFVDSELGKDLESAGFEVEAVMPGFYEGERDCVVIGASEDADRMSSADLAAAQITERVLAEKRGTPGLHVAVDTERATVDDAQELADLLDETFQAYPTPSGDAAYVAQQLREGTPFRVVRDGDEIVACASADLVPSARTAELTDCATRPRHRGNGYMQTILVHLMDDLREMRYPTAFTLARARIPGVNVAFQRCGFKLRGRRAQSCRIGGGLEDMNVWSRRL